MLFSLYDINQSLEKLISAFKRRINLYKISVNMLVVVFGLFLEVTFTECNVIVAPDILNYKVLVFFFCILLIERRVSP